MTNYEIRETRELEFNPGALLVPVPNMDEMRRIKSEQGYSGIPIDTSNELFNEPVVDLADYSISGSSYYSRPNAATGEAVPGIDRRVYLRRSVANQLLFINSCLRKPGVTEFFGGDVQLYIEDSLRPLDLQQRLYDEIFPKIIREQQPDLSEVEIMKRRDQLIAKPSTDPARPSPHATGGAFDVDLRYASSSPEHKYGDKVEMGHVDGDTSERVNPDYFETHEPDNDRDRLAQRNRRAFYAIMSGTAFGIDTGFANNPTEWWHWGKGDQLSALVSGLPNAVYSFAEAPAPKILSPEERAVRQEIDDEYMVLMSDNPDATIAWQKQRDAEQATTTKGSVMARGGNFNKTPGEIAAQQRQESNMPVHGPTDPVLKEIRKLGGLAAASSEDYSSGRAKPSSSFSDGSTGWAE